jgi:glucan biosynthesis protein
MEIEYSLFGFKLGIEKRISPQSSIVLIGAVERTSINIEASIHETSGLSMTFGVKEVETSFQGSIAVRFFY